MQHLLPALAELIAAGSSESTWWIERRLYDRADPITQQLLLDSARAIPLVQSEWVIFYNDRGNLYGAPPIGVRSPLYYETGALGFLIVPEEDRLELIHDAWIDVPPAPARLDDASRSLQLIRAGYPSDRLWPDYENPYHALPLPRTGYEPLMIRKLFDQLGGKRVIAYRAGRLDCYYYIPAHRIEPLQISALKRGTLWQLDLKGAPTLYQSGDYYHITIASEILGGDL